MALSNFFIDIVSRLLIVFIFVLVNAMIIREIVVFFKAKDDTMMTSTAISIWIGAILLLSSFLTDIKVFGWVIAVLANLFFIYLYKKYYLKDWKESILIWEMWISTLIYLGIFVAAISAGLWTLILWGLIRLMINISYVLLLKLNFEKHWVNITTTLLGFFAVNVIWVVLFRVYLGV